MRGGAGVNISIGYPGDGWKYWRMTSDIRQSRVLNRARADPQIAGAKEEQEDMNETPSPYDVWAPRKR
jgi:hypothetical protein